MLFRTVLVDFNEWNNVLATPDCETLEMYKKKLFKIKEHADVRINNQSRNNMANKMRLLKYMDYLY